MILRVFLFITILISATGFASTPTELALDNEFTHERANLIINGHRPDTQLVTIPHQVRHLNWPVLLGLCHQQTPCSLHVLAHVNASGEGGVVISPSVILNTVTGAVNPTLFYQFVQGRFYIGRFTLVDSELTLTLRSQLPHEVGL